MSTDKEYKAGESDAGDRSIKELLLQGQVETEQIIETHFPKLAFTLDEGTVLMLDELRRPTLASRAAISRLIIKEVKDSPELFPIAEFCERTWNKLYFSSAQLKRVVQLPLPRELNLYLRKTSEQILGVENRSEMFRILVAFYAIQKRVAELVPPAEVFVLKINGHGSSVEPHSQK